MPILRNTQKSRFTVIDNSCLENENLSFEAKGLLSYLLSKPDEWNINTKQLCRAGGCGRDRIRRIYRELESAGYLRFERPRKDDGKVLGQNIVITEPDVLTESLKNRRSEKPTVGKSGPLVNTVSGVNTVPVEGSTEKEPEGFAEFWSAYPRKVGKGEARKRWNKIKPSRELQAKMIWVVEQQKRSAEWQRDNGKFIPHPATWLNQERWEDEILPSGGRPNGGFVA